ncbi:glycosyltransferase [Acidisoma sp.]|uniref:glycosyltransferase n=1 Tax=Acidisoma sp. TaxID=1872115 RepID=UPI003B00E6DE
MTPTALIYRDVILPASEAGFMRRQYLGFSQLRPLWVGRQITPVAASANLAVHRLGGDGPAGVARRVLFKEIGLVPDLDALRAQNPVVVHAQFGRGGAFALPLARALNIPLVVTFHGGDAHKNKHYRGGFPPALFIRRLPALIKEARLFVCVSESVRTKLMARGFPAEKLIVLPIGTDIPGEVPPGPLQGPLLFAGRLVPKKGVSVLIDALQMLRAEGREPEAAIVGDGPLADELHHQAAGLERLRFLGWQSAEALAGLMREAALLVVPSIAAADGDAEGLPSVAMEAMALALPVLASDEAGLAGAVVAGETGVLVPALNAHALATAITGLMDDPLRRLRLGRAAAHLMRRDFDAQVQSRRLEALLLGVVN